MLTLQQIKQDPQDIIRRLAVKGFDGTEPINRILELDAERRRLQLENDNAAAQLKKHAEAIGALMKSGDRAAAEDVARAGRVLDIDLLRGAVAVLAVERGEHRTLSAHRDDHAADLLRRELQK